MSRAFSLAGLLRVRNVQQREAAQQLSRAAIEARQTEARDRHLRAALGAGTDAVDGRSLAALAATRAAGRAMLAEVAVLGEQHQQQLRAAQSVHDARRREVRGLEKLADAHDERVRAEELRGEQLEIDEIAGRMTEEA